MFFFCFCFDANANKKKITINFLNSQVIASQLSSAVPYPGRLALSSGWAETREQENSGGAVGGVLFLAPSALLSISLS